MYFGAQHMHIMHQNMMCEHSLRVYPRVRFVAEILRLKICSSMCMDFRKPYSDEGDSRTNVYNYRYFFACKFTLVVALQLRNIMEV